MHGFVAANDRQANATYLEHELRMFTTGATEAGRPGMAPTGREASYEPGCGQCGYPTHQRADRLTGDFPATRSDPRAKPAPRGRQGGR